MKANSPLTQLQIQRLIALNDRLTELEYWCIQRTRSMVEGYMWVLFCEELSKYDSLAEWVVGGAVLHPYEQSTVMFLGDKICADKPAICTKNPLIPPHLRAIY
ncbi:hypothetical protein ACVBEG_13540 [Pseudomonas sp. GG8]